MVHLCISISDDGLKLESIQKGSPKTRRKRENKSIAMTTLRRQPISRTASTRQERGSCSSTASCPVFSGPYSDHEEDPPLRRQSSPLLKGSLSSLLVATRPSPESSLSSLQRSINNLQGSLPSLEGSRPSFQCSLPNLKGSISRLKRRSLGSLDNVSPGSREGSTSPTIQSSSGSSSDEDGSWDTNSWSSGATCLLRSPVAQDSTETSDQSGGTSFDSDHVPTSSAAEPEIIYQNLVFTRPAANAESNGDSAPESTSAPPTKDAGTLSVSSSCLSKYVAVSPRQWDEKADDKREFSQFLNEVTGRVLKSKGSPPHQQPNLRRRYPSPPPPPPPSTPFQQHSAPTNLPLPPTSAAGLWYSPASSSLHTIKEYDSKDMTSSFHQWSQTLPSCKILEPGDVWRKEEEKSHSYSLEDMQPCTKIQAQPSTGRLYLETDIDSVRRLDELVANGTLGKEKNEKGQEKGTERGKERESRIPLERNGGLGVEKGKEWEKKNESPWERERGGGKGKGKDVGRGRPWEKDRTTQRGREKEKKGLPKSYGHPSPQLASSGRINPCPAFCWPEGFPKMSYRSTSLPRPVNITVSIHLLFSLQVTEIACLVVLVSVQCIARK